MRNSHFENLGLTLWIVGGLIFLFAVLAFDTSVEVNTLSSGLIELPDRVVNLQRVAQQILLALLGATFFGSGFVIYALALMLNIQNFITESEEILQPTTAPLGGEFAHQDAECLTDQMDDEYTDEELMEKFDIKEEGDHYVFESHRYEKLADAVGYALNQKR